MNREAGAMKPATPPRADRLRFVGQADLEAQLKHINDNWDGYDLRRCREEWTRCAAMYRALKESP